MALILPVTLHIILGLFLYTYIHIIHAYYNSYGHHWEERRPTLPISEIKEGLSLGLHKH